ncbi:MAG TPA: FG-GAP-like repeat-containing protein, partial [Acidimicrobiales bacterium]
MFGAVALAATTVVPPPAHAAGGFTALPGAVSPLAASGGNYNVGTHVTVDVDSDGDLDVAVREPVSDATIDVLRNDGGAFTTLTGAASPFASISFPSSPTNFLNSRVLTGDFDVDGDVDLWHHGVGFAAFYRNDDGTFSAHTGAADPLAQLASYDPGTYEVIDVDGDTDPDVVAREPTGDASLVLLRNDGGTFVASAAPLAAVAFGAHASNFLNVNVLVLDADDDGDLDLWHHGVGFAAFYRNDGGTFSAHTGAADPLAELAGYYSHSYVTADVDSDGDLDVVAREPSGGLTIDVLRNDGGGFTRLTGAASPFAAVTLATTDFETAHLLVGDHDDDGDADIYNHALDELYVQAGSAPRLVARTPARGSTDIAVTSSLTLTFDEAVVAGAGAIVVRDASPNTVVEHVSVTGDAGQISGTGTTTVTITPSVPWPFATTLTVTVEPGAFVSAADGDAFAGAAPVTWLFTTAANTPPQLANLDGDTVTWVEGDSAVALDAAAPSTVVDGDGVGFDGGSLSVAVTDAVAGEDRLSFAPADHLGSVSSDDTTLTIALDGDADAAALGALLHSLAYENDAGDDPTPGDRVVTVTLTDQGGLTSTAIITVSVVAVNDPPVISAPAGYLVDAGAEVTIGDVTIEDVDSDVLHLNATVDVGAFGDGTTTFTRDGSAADLMTAID